MLLTNEDVRKTKVAKGLFSFNVYNGQITETSTISDFPATSVTAGAVAKLAAARYDANTAHL